MTRHRVHARRDGSHGTGLIVAGNHRRCDHGCKLGAGGKRSPQSIGIGLKRLLKADAAGRTMADMVARVQRVSDLIGQISTATTEQGRGISQVGDAVTQLDQVTQQNAALVEEMAAAASALKQQAQDLVQVVSVFRLGAHEVRSATPAPALPRRATPIQAAKPPVLPAQKRVQSLPKPAARPASAPATTEDDGDWSSF